MTDFDISMRSMRRRNVKTANVNRLCHVTDVRDDIKSHINFTRSKKIATFALNRSSRLLFGKSDG